MKKSRFSKLKGLIVSMDMKQEDLAKKLGMSNPAFNRRLNEHKDFELKEIREICKELSIPDNKIKDYFFN
jgi:DNA-binding Xre family transcriptional regulator